ncbi:hypothetical protein FDG2_0133 [Candidatus Protofrankia californiensis]|uniref:Uncharacterized protein n=1 Tax=Candidatus Protofrankia californiensis TaxID=1839754 RepID=A0A1C3NSY4_9ACTN|nr:hypothetical protein [Candidatus Protofrankia californiensis]SBW17253.1 hypothetical protein FDG2_0133 [Candidatus Protofrankia californiensis]
MTAVSQHERDSDDGRDVRGVRMMVSTVSGTADLYVCAGVGPDELIRVLATYIPARARLESTGLSGGELVFHFTLG